MSKASIKTYKEIHADYLKLLSKPGVSLICSLDSDEEPAIQEAVSQLEGAYTPSEIFEGGLFIFESDWDAGQFFKVFARLNCTHIHARLYTPNGDTLSVAGY